MNKQFLFLTLFVAFSIFQVSAQKLHVLNFSTVQEMRQYFKYEKNKKIISGHRGTIENGLPENSIVGMQEVLKHTTAIFEIDPRLTKDGVAVMLHDATLERTTTGSGKLSDYTWQELKELKLRDSQGNITPYSINTLDEMIEWAKGKTVLNLDKKDLPMEMTAEIVRKHNAYRWVWVTVHNVEQARFYLDKNPDQYLSMHIKTQEALDDFISSGLPFDRMIVYIGPEIKPANQQMYNFFKEKGVMCMISAAPTYDKLQAKEDRRNKYRMVFDDGANILESDFPIEVSQAIK
ncbi:glycerophosphodiester phosphodiesterase family protein [Sphingobacterium alkalisoli]|uniref:Glycerophosphodiester phosphodiesterase family protein n=1 Tax=Sphingobacterium alkalisoli TaxID=1874115 RepID=A0A4U0GUH6_9SPHI|nr:glycerophosphodiester phosphodiesterase family protein [Sphingobacterium alkalisoli]TJY62741.1 glycerophosphodiester phosphodiesterase family protein [Sphingobacterium alkalisoli]GGH28581.1 glycerophosphoryl diester phosphodiesterase [Sphingobacterium alkalisoli]